MIKNRTAQLIYQTIYVTLGLVGCVACLGIFDNMLSREHAIPADAPAKTFTRENKGKWVLKEYEITPMQLAELDECYDDMMKFVERNYNK